MEKNKGKVKLDDELLDKISGGCDDPYVCEWSPTNTHEWEPCETSSGVTELRCKWCQINCIKTEHGFEIPVRTTLPLSGGFSFARNRRAQPFTDRLASCNSSRTFH